MITILGAIALVALIANLVFCIKNLTEEVKSKNVILATFANIIAVPCIILLFAVLISSSVN